MSVFYRNWTYRLKCRERKENFQTITVIIFLSLTMFQYRPDWPQEWSILKEFRVVNYRIVTNSNYVYAIQRWLSFGKPLWVICCSKEIKNQLLIFFCAKISPVKQKQREVYSDAWQASKPLAILAKLFMSDVRLSSECISNKSWHRLFPKSVYRFWAHYFWCVQI